MRHLSFAIERVSLSASELENKMNISYDVYKGNCAYGAGFT